jgi:hypothetical protein
MNFHPTNGARTATIQCAAHAKGYTAKNGIKPFQQRKSGYTKAERKASLVIGTSFTNTLKQGHV